MYIDYNHLNQIGLTSENIINFIQAVESDHLTNIKTVMLYKDNKKLVAFEKKPYSLIDKHLLFSITKSITAVAVGIAIEKGLITLTDKLASFFPDKLPDEISENLNNVTIENLLTMTSGLHDNTYDILYPKKDWVKAFLEQEFPHKPGEFYRYSTHGSQMLSAIIQRVAKISLYDFVNEYLFKPLEIDSSEWEMTSDGITTGGMGLSLDSESLCKIASLLLNKGRYQGKNIISRDYVELATKRHIYKHTEIDIENKTYTGKYYGYHIHIGIEDTYRFDGAFGQVCICVPKINLVIAVTSQYSKLENLLSYIHKYLIPKEIVLKKDQFDNKEALKHLIENLSYETHFKHPDKFDDYNELKINFDIVDQINELSNISFEKRADKIDIISKYINGTFTKIEFDLSKPIFRETWFIKDINWKTQKYYSYSKWIDEDTLELVVFYLETPYVVTHTVIIKEQQITLNYRINKSFTQKNFSCNGKIIS